MDDSFEFEVVPVSMLVADCLGDGFFGGDSRKVFSCLAFTATALAFFLFLYVLDRV